MTSAPAPYNMATDNVIMLLFILNIIGISYVTLMNGPSIVERTKGLFYYRHNSIPFNDRMHITKVCNIVMYAQTIFYLTILTMAAIREYTPLEIEKHPLHFLGLYSGVYLLFFILKRVVYDIINSILYTKKELLEWRNLYFFTIKLLGFALAPAAIAILFIPSISFNYVSVYIILTACIYVYTITSGLFKIIFIKKKNYLEIFLYLCALEFLPIAMVWKSLLQLSGLITTNF